MPLYGHFWPLQGILMHFRTVLLAASLIAASSLAFAGAPAHKTDAQVRKAIIQQSIAQYPGVCACPYNVTRSGRRCGRRSAYSKPGGYAPKCYASDVSDKEVKAWRKRHRD